MHIKKNLFILSSFVLFALPGAYAQKFTLGLRGGFVVSTITAGKNNPGRSFLSPMPSYSFGSTMHYRFSDSSSWSLRAEPGYSRLGCSYKDAMVNGNIALEYINVPLLVSFSPVSKLYIEAGPEFAFLGNSKIIVDGKPRRLRNYEYMTVSGIIGVSYDVMNRVNAGIRYSHGVTRVSNTVFYDGNGRTLSNTKEFAQYGEVFVRLALVRSRS
jgi:hypothetical protein